MKEEGPWESMERLHEHAANLRLKEPLSDARSIFGVGWAPKC